MKLCKYLSYSGHLLSAPAPADVQGTAFTSMAQMFQGIGDRMVDLSPATVALAVLSLPVLYILPGLLRYIRAYLILLRLPTPKASSFLAGHSYDPLKVKQQPMAASRSFLCDTIIRSCACHGFICPTRISCLQSSEPGCDWRDAQKHLQENEWTKQLGTVYRWRLYWKQVCPLSYILIIGLQPWDSAGAKKRMVMSGTSGWSLRTQHFRSRSSTWSGRETSTSLALRPCGRQSR